MLRALASISRLSVETNDCVDNFNGLDASMNPTIYSHDLHDKLFPSSRISILGKFSAKSTEEWASMVLKLNRRVSEGTIRSLVTGSKNCS